MRITNNKDGTLDIEAGEIRLEDTMCIYDMSEVPEKYQYIVGFMRQFINEIPNRKKMLSSKEVWEILQSGFDLE